MAFVAVGEHIAALVRPASHEEIVLFKPFPQCPEPHICGMCDDCLFQCFDDDWE